MLRPPLGQERRFLKKLGTFFNLGTIFNFYSKIIILKTETLCALNVALKFPWIQFPVLVYLVSMALVYLVSGTGDYGVV